MAMSNDERHEKEACLLQACMEADNVITLQDLDREDSKRSRAITWGDNVEYQRARKLSHLLVKGSRSNTCFSL